MVPETDYCRISGCIKSGSIEIETEIALNTGRRAFVAEIEKDGAKVKAAKQGETVSLMVLNLYDRDMRDLPNDLIVEAVDDFYEQRLSAELKSHNSKIKVLDVPPTTDELDDPFKMEVESAFWIEAKKGYLLTGKITGGIIGLDETIRLSNGMKAKVKEFDNGEDNVCAFDKNVGILITGIKKGALDGVESLVATM